MLRNTKLTAVVMRNVVFSFCLIYLFCLVELPIITNKIECQIFSSQENKAVTSSSGQAPSTCCQFIIKITRVTQQNCIFHMYTVADAGPCELTSTWHFLAEKCINYVIHRTNILCINVLEKEFGDIIWLHSLSNFLSK